MVGVFATKDIREGEVLASIPWKHIIADEEEPNMDIRLPCATTHKLLEELSEVYDNPGGEDVNIYYDY